MSMMLYINDSDYLFCYDLKSNKGISTIRIDKYRNLYKSQSTFTASASWKEQTAKGNFGRKLLVPFKLLLNEDAHDRFT